MLSPSASGLSELMNHHIKYNSKKSAVLVCKSKYIKNGEVPSFKINGEVPSFKINGEVIKEVYHVKYLGHFICNTFRDEKDILGHLSMYTAQL